MARAPTPSELPMATPMRREPTSKPSTVLLVESMLASGTTAVSGDQEQIDTERKAFEEKDLELYMNVNDAFHQIIADSSGNSTLAGYVKNILSRTYVQTIFFESFFNFADNPSLDEHIRLMEALKEHDEAKCVKLMEEHIRLAMEALRQ